MNVAITAATNADLPAVLDLLQRTKLPRAEIERHVSTILVAKEGERIVGCAALEPYGTAALLRSLAVEPSSRGLGLGQQLTRAALDLARGRGVKSVYLLTETAAEFFPRFGFRTVPRKEVDPAVQRSIEFTGACPDSAIAMRADITG